MSALSKVVVIIPTAQKQNLHVAIQSLSGEILQEVPFNQTGSSPVVKRELTNNVGEPVTGETADYLLRLDLQDFTSQQNISSDVNQRPRSCMLSRPQEHTCTCFHCQVGLLLDRAQGIRDDIQATFALLGDQPLSAGSLC